MADERQSFAEPPSFSRARVQEASESQSYLGIEQDEQEALSTDLNKFLALVEARLSAKGETLSNSDRKELARRFVASRGTTIGGADIPTRQVPSYPGFIERNARPGLAAVGGLVGSTAGIPGMLTGAAIGGGAGQTISEVAQSQREGTGGVSQALRNTTVNPLELAQSPALHRSLKAGAGEALFEGAAAGVPIYGGALVRNKLWRLAGVGDDAAYRMVREAEAQKIGLGIKDVSRHDIVRSAPRTLGLFPWVHGPISKAYVHQAKAIRRGADNLMERVAPVMGYARVSNKVYKGGRKSFEVFKETANNRYTRGLDAAAKEGSIIPLESTKKTAQSVRERLFSLPPTRNAKGELVAKAPTGSDTLIKFLDYLDSVEDSMTVDEYKSLVDELARQFESAKSLADASNSSRNVEYLARIKEGLEMDFGNINAPDYVKKLLNDADTFFKETSPIFETPTAQRFGRVEKNVFKVGFEEPGSLNPDELLRAVWNKKSPEAMRDLRRLLMERPRGDSQKGRRVWNEAVSSRLDEIFEASRTPSKVMEDADVLSWTKIRKDLGIANKKSNEYAAFVEMLRGTGVRPREFEKLMDISEKVFQEGIPDVSTFVRRRAILGGRRSLTRTFTGGAIIGVGGVGVYDPIMAGIGAAAWILSARHLGKIVTNPKALRTAMEVARPGMTRTQQLAAMRRLQVAIPTLFAIRDATGQAVRMTAEEVLDLSQQAVEARKDFLQDYHKRQRNLGRRTFGAAGLQTTDIEE